MSIYYLSIGSNINPSRHVPACLKRLSAEFRVIAFSTIYETRPVGPAGPEPFWNLAASIEDGRSRKDLSVVLRSLEEDLGRKRDPANKYAARTIDIDILPQEGFQQMAFIMIPLAQIAPDERDPETGLSFRELAGKLESQKSDLKAVADDPGYENP